MMAYYTQGCISFHSRAWVILSHGYDMVETLTHLVAYMLQWQLRFLGG